MIRKGIVKDCDGCSKVWKVWDTDFCIAYENPAMKHRLNRCPLHSVMVVENVKKSAGVVRAAKRKGRK